MSDIMDQNSRVCSLASGHNFHEWVATFIAKFCANKPIISQNNCNNTKDTAIGTDWKLSSEWEGFQTQDWQALPSEQEVTTEDMMILHPSATLKINGWESLSKEWNGTTQ